MFKAIESDEEFEAALTAGLLWINNSTISPRPVSTWHPADWYAETYWRGKTSNPLGYMPEDFAVLVEEDE